MILIIDFGSQYTTIIAQRIREASVFCKIIPYDAIFESLPNKLEGIILSSGPDSILEKDSPRFQKWVVDANVPILGICYGMQALVYQLGGKLNYFASTSSTQFGDSEIFIQHWSDLFANIRHTNLKLRISDGDTISQLPNGFKCIAKSSRGNIVAIEFKEKKIYGVQFHPEVTRTIEGRKYLENFLNICKCERSWVPESVFESIKQSTLNELKDDKVIVDLSGSVESAVVTVLLYTILGPERVACVFMNHGFFRKNETDILEYLKQICPGLFIHKHDASNAFLEALRDISNSEEKRKIINKLFIDEFKKVKDNLFSEYEWIAQETIYPDIINFSVNESHHTIQGLAEVLNCKSLEPICQLFKDEVRNLGIFMKIPHEIEYRCTYIR